MMSNQDIRNHLVQLIVNQEELFTSASGIDNEHVACLLKKCLTSELEACPSSRVSEIEIGSILDYLYEELHTGHWSEVPSEIRRAYTASSFIKAVVLLNSATQCTESVLKAALKVVDYGLLLGAPLEENSTLLVDSAAYISKQLLLLRQGGESTVPKQESLKRKLDEGLEAQHNRVKGIDVDVLDCPSLEHFNLNYFIPQVPAKLIGCMSHWPAVTKWLDVEYLLKVAGDRTVPVELGSHYVDANWSQKLLTIREFIEKYYLGEAADLGYLAQHNLFDQISELKEDIRIPEYCCLSSDYENSIDPDVNAWLGPKGTVSPLHYDPKSNLLAQVFGAKEVILFAPTDSEYLYPYSEEMLFNTARVNPVGVDTKEFPLFPKATMYRCLLKAGEMLFIPRKWWHHVTALTKSFSVSFWWD